MALEPKWFQNVTVEAAVTALTSGSRRFLLADEVGLGKTVVAREVIAKLALHHLDRPFRVFYFGSGRTVTTQNAPRLVPLSSPDRLLTAELCDASRPTLIAMEQAPKARLQIYQFTPDTAVPRVHGRGRSGVAIERALLRVLVAKVLRYRLPRRPDIRAAFQGAASEKNFRAFVRNALRQYRAGNLMRGFGLADAFRDATREVFRVGPNGQLAQHLTKALKEPREFVAMLRLALTRAALNCLPPDLIVFDEFHRYRDRVFALPPKEEDGEDVFLSLLPRNARPAILLLSATPFHQTQLASRSDGAQADSDNFHRLVGFLHGPGQPGVDAYHECRRLFGEFEWALSGRRPDAAEITRVRNKLQEKLLRPRMARMERAAFRPMNDDGAPSPTTNGLPIEKDLELFVRFAAGLDKKDRPAAIAYWRSVPYPHQFLGNEYAAWRRASHSKWRDLTGITREQRGKLRMRAEIPHMRLRELLRAFPPELLASPWMPPSLPWWPLKGPWAEQGPSGRVLEKGLLFSLFRAVPRAVAGLLSFAVEDWAARQRGWRNLAKLNRQSFLSPKSLTVVTLFHPSLWLAEAIEPLGVKERSVNALLRHAAQSIRERLPASVSFEPRSDRHRPLWKVLPMIERESGQCLPLRDVWGAALGKQGQSGQVGRALARMENNAARIAKTISPAELADLAWFGLSAPGVVLLRALRRHSEFAGAAESLREVADLSWHGLRSYLDRPWFVARLMKGRRFNGYAEAIQHAVIEGNLESVLDEHFWLPDPDHDKWLKSGRRDGRLAALRNTLSIRSAPVRVLLPQGRGRAGHLTLSAHAALPLTDTEAHTAARTGVQQLRADDLRRAFNTPFWPYLLCTTSVGQEGLDFHQWCRTVVHWDLCANPVDIEQREGRVDRYKSLAVRKALAANGAGSGLDGLSTWKDLEQHAQAYADESGLAPWWVCNGAAMERLHFDPPSSEERARRERLERLRELYRLVLGLPHHRDVMQRLAASGITPEEIRSYCLDLGALRRPQII